MATQTMAPKPRTLEKAPAEPEQTREPADRIAVLAYQYWQERGCPIGSPEVDWFRAEQEIATAK